MARGRGGRPQPSELPGHVRGVAWVTSLATSALAAGSAGGVMVGVLGREEIAIPAPLTLLDLVEYRMEDAALQLLGRARR